MTAPVALPRRLKGRLAARTIGRPLIPGAVAPVAFGVAVLGGGAVAGAAPPRDCATRLVEAPRSAAQAIGESLVPGSRKGGIDEILVCRYFGAPLAGTPVGGHSRRGRLAAGHEVTGRRPIKDLRTQLNRLAPAREPEESTTTCPYDSGAGYYMLFRYRFHPPVVVLLTFGACSSIVSRNDDSATNYVPTHSLLRRLERLAPIPKPTDRVRGG
jgi:hypothetical protein